MYNLLKTIICILIIILSISSIRADFIFNEYNLHSGSLNHQSKNIFFNHWGFTPTTIPAGPGSLKLDVTYKPVFSSDNYIYNGCLTDNENTDMKSTYIFINYTLNLGLGINALYKKSSDFTDISNFNNIEFYKTRYRSILSGNQLHFSKYHIALSYNNNLFNIFGLNAYTWYDNITADNNNEYLIESSYGVQAKLKYNINNNLSVIGDIAYITYSDISENEMNSLQSELKISPALIISDGYNRDTRPEIKFFVSYGSSNNPVKDVNVTSAVQKTNENSFLAFGVHGEAWW